MEEEAEGVSRRETVRARLSATPEWARHIGVTATPNPLGQRVCWHQSRPGEELCCWCGAWRAGWLYTTCLPSLAGTPLRIGSALAVVLA